MVKTRRNFKFKYSHSNYLVDLIYQKYAMYYSLGGPHTFSFDKNNLKIALEDKIIEHKPKPAKTLKQRVKNLLINVYPNSVATLQRVQATKPL